MSDSNLNDVTGTEEVDLPEEAGEPPHSMDEQDRIDFAEEGDDDGA